MTNLSHEQQQIYNYVVKMLKKHSVLNKKNAGIPYTIIDGPLQT